jgi:hypothetical protein
VPTAAQDQKAIEQETRAAEKEAASNRQRRALEKQQAEVRAAMGKEPDQQRAVDERAAIMDEINTLERKLVQLKARYEAAHERALEVQTAQRVWDQQQVILNRKVEGATSEDVAAADEAVEIARQLAQRNQLCREMLDVQAKLSQVQDVQRIAKKRSTRLREIAEGIPAVMADLLKEAGLPGLTIAGERLAILTGDGQLLDFETRLSFGQRTRFALQIALGSRPSTQPKILALDAEFWGALDPDRRQEVHQIAVETGVTILTEEPTLGTLRVEPFEQ